MANPQPPVHRRAPSGIPQNFTRWRDMVDRRLHVLENKRPKSAGAIPWFYGEGPYTGEGRNLSIEGVQPGSSLSENTSAVVPTIYGLWQVTFGWDVSNTLGDGEVDFSVNGTMDEVVPANDGGDGGFSSVNQRTGAFLGGPGHGISASVGGAWDGFGWAAGHLICEMPPPNDT